jgi:hypothetical protein
VSWHVTVTLTPGLTSAWVTSALISAVAFWRRAGHQVLARYLVFALDPGVGPRLRHLGPTTVRGKVSQQRRETDKLVCYSPLALRSLDTWFIGVVIGRRHDPSVDTA